MMVNAVLYVARLRVIESGRGVSLSLYEAAMIRLDEIVHRPGVQLEYTLRSRRGTVDYNDRCQYCPSRNHADAPSFEVAHLLMMPSSKSWSIDQMLFLLPLVARASYNRTRIQAAGKNHSSIPHGFVPSDVVIPLLDAAMFDE